MPVPTTAPGDWLPEAFAFGLEELVLRQAAGEAEEARVRDHPVGRAHAAPSDCPTPLQQLERLEHAEAPELAETIEEPLDLADVGAVRENDAAGAQRSLGRRRSLPRLCQVQEHPVYVPLVDALVDIAQLQRQVGRQCAEGFHDASLGGLEKLLPCLVADHSSLRADRA